LRTSPRRLQKEELAGDFAKGLAQERTCYSSRKHLKRHQLTNSQLLINQLGSKPENEQVRTGQKGANIAADLRSCGSLEVSTDVTSKQTFQRSREGLSAACALTA